MHFTIWELILNDSCVLAGYIFGNWVARKRQERRDRKSGRVWTCDECGLTIRSRADIVANFAVMHNKDIHITPSEAQSDYPRYFNGEFKDYS